jgi:hypothetical protein
MHQIQSPEIFSIHNMSLLSIFLDPRVRIRTKTSRIPNTATILYSGQKIQPDLERVQGLQRFLPRNVTNIPERKGLRFTYSDSIFRNR